MRAHAAYRPAGVAACVVLRSRTGTPPRRDLGDGTGAPTRGRTCFLHESTEVLHFMKDARRVVGFPARRSGRLPRRPRRRTMAHRGHPPGCPPVIETWRLGTALTGRLENHTALPERAWIRHGCPRALARVGAHVAQLLPGPDPSTTLTNAKSRPGPYFSDRRRRLLTFAFRLPCFRAKSCLESKPVTLLVLHPLDRTHSQAVPVRRCRRWRGRRVRPGSGGAGETRCGAGCWVRRV